MPLTLGLYTPRRSFFPFSGPLAREALRRGHRVRYVRDVNAMKPDDDWRSDELPDAIRAPVCPSPWAFRGDWLIGPPPFPAPPGVRIAHIEAWYDNQRLGESPCDLRHRTLEHGMIALDGIQDVRRRPPTDLVWFVPKTRVPGPQRFTRFVITHLLGLQLWRVARRHHLRLVIKTRSKIRLTPVLRRLAGQVVEDASLYPWTSLRVLARAALAVVHQSAAGCEAVAMRVPALSVRMPHRHLEGTPLWALQAARKESPFAWPGLIEALNLEEAIRWLDHWETPPHHYPLREREKYMYCWLGGRIVGACAELITRLEKSTAGCGAAGPG